MLFRSRPSLAACPHRESRLTCRRELQPWNLHQTFFGMIGRSIVVSGEPGRVPNWYGRIRKSGAFCAAACRVRTCARHHRGGTDAGSALHHGTKGALFREIPDVSNPSERSHKAARAVLYRGRTVAPFFGAALLERLEATCGGPLSLFLVRRSAPLGDSYRDDRAMALRPAASNFAKKIPPRLLT